MDAMAGIVKVHLIVLASHFSVVLLSLLAAPGGGEWVLLKIESRRGRIPLPRSGRTQGGKGAIHR